MKAYYGSSTTSSSAALPNPSKYFTADSRQILSAKSSSSKSIGNTNYVSSLLPTSLFRPDSASAAIGSSSSSSRSADENFGAVSVRPSSSGGIASQRTQAATGNSKSGSYQSLPPPNAKALFPVSSGLGSSNLLGQQLQGMSGSPPVGVLLSRERRSSSCNDVIFRESLENNNNGLLAPMRNSNSAGSASLNPGGGSKKVRFSVNLVSYTPHMPTYVPGSPLVSCMKGSAAAHASRSLLSNSSQKNINGCAAVLPASGNASPATQSPPTPHSKDTPSSSMTSASKGKLFLDVAVKENSIGGSADNNGEGSSTESALPASQTTNMDLNGNGNRGRSSPSLQPSSTAGSPKLVPVHMSPKPTQKKLLVEKQPSSSLMSSALSLSHGETMEGASSSLTSTSSSPPPSDSPVAALIAKSVAVGNFISNNQTSVRFYSSRVEFSVATHPQLYDRAYISQATQALSSVTLNYTDMTGISIAGTKLRFKIPRKCTPFSDTFEPDSTLFQFAVDLNSVVSSSIVKQKVMPLICPVMFGGTK